MWTLLVVVLVVGQSTGSGAHSTTVEIPKLTEKLCYEAKKTIASQNSQASGLFPDGNRYSKGTYSVLTYCVKTS